MFNDRHEAGCLLTHSLENYRANPEVIILGLARGGVVVAFELAKNLSLPLNVIIPRKIGAPGNSELALGAIMENGEMIFNDSLIRSLNISSHFIQQQIKDETAKAQQRLALYRQVIPLPNLKGKIVILVDDGIATGATMLVAIKAMRSAQVQKIIVAVPVAATDSLLLIEEVVDEVICLHNQEDFFGVGCYYKNFKQVEDKEVIHLLKLQEKESFPNSNELK